jgi:hemerythrin
VDGREELSAEVLDYLTDWWLGHINKTDQAMADFLTRQAS